MTKKYKKETPQIVETEVTVAEEVVEPIIEPVVEEARPEFVFGVVANCEKLYVRKAPKIVAEAIGIIDAGDEVEIDVDLSTEKFYRVITASGLKGFCMKEYINLK